MNTALVIDVESKFVNSNDDVTDEQSSAPLTSFIEILFSLTQTAASIVFFFWLLICIFSAMAPFIGVILSAVVTFFIGIPIALQVDRFANAILNIVSDFVFNKILKPVENWIIKFFNK